MIAMGERGHIKIPLEMLEEITVGNDEVTEWMKESKDALLLDESVSEDLVTLVTEQGYANDLNDDEIEKVGRDPFLIAYALADLGQRCVVSTEVSKPTATRANRKVPDVCAHFKIPCCNTFALIRELDFNTNWNAR